jgi:hypothetical protein
MGAESQAAAHSHSLHLSSLVQSPHPAFQATEDREARLMAELREAEARDVLGGRLGLWVS